MSTKGKRKNSIKLNGIEEQNLADYLFSEHSESHKALEAFKFRFNVEIYPADNIGKINLKGVDGGEIEKAKKGFSQLATRFANGEQMNDGIIKMVASHSGVKQQFIEAKAEIIENGRLKRENNAQNRGERQNPEENLRIVKVEARNDNQIKFLSEISKNDVTFGVGPAGTGKTFLAAFEAVKALKEGKVEKIFLARPAIGNGKDLGALPGDEKAKLAPYLRPIYDELENLIGKDTLTALQEKGFVEIAPVEFMRGRTFKNAFIILDEAQNTTEEQIKMALTRIGENSTMVVTGDVTQIDLPKGQPSGLNYALRKLANVEDIAIRQFTAKDIVRSKVVSRIVMAFEAKSEPKLTAKNDNMTSQSAVKNKGYRN